MPQNRLGALVIQHERDGPAGLVGDELIARGYELHVVEVLGTEIAEGAPLPDPTSFDLVVSLGCVQSVYDSDAVGAWIDGELATLAKAADNDVPVFGVCFGAQALAAALGGTVEPAIEPEIGWVHVDSDQPEIASGPWFTWHVDRFVLPDSMSALARTGVGAQAFRSGRSLGVQFHPEVDRDRVAHWVAGCPPGYWTRHGVDPQTMLDEFAHHGAPAAANLVRLVDWFLDDVAR